MDNYINDIKTYFRNVVLNSVGADRDLYRLLANGDVDGAVAMMQDRDNEVDKAIAEYNTQTHRVMYRPNKARKNQPDFVTNKLPRNRQHYINEVELFFLLGNPIRWDKGDGDPEAFALFSGFLREQHFDARMRQAKRLAGAETECAVLYRVYQEEGEARCDTVVLARSTGYRLRPLFDQYGRMLAFACGYRLRTGSDGQEERWDVYTRQMVFECRRTPLGWRVESRANPLGKIPVVYIRQLKAWDGAVPRIAREEHLDSNTADTNDYFSNPIAKATADVIESLADPEETGKLIQLRGPSSSFDYVNPPTSSATREGEKRDLNESILFDTFTPDLSFENMRGLGSVSGVAIKNAMVLAYIKRANRAEIYEEMVERQKNVMLEVLALRNPGMASKLRELGRTMTFEFSEPFATDDRDRMALMASLHTQEVLSLDECVRQLGIAEDPEAEIEKIKAEIAEKAAMAGGADPSLGQPMGETAGTENGPSAE